MDAEHREDFERRLLAKVRSSLDYLDEANPQGYEIEHFVLTFRYYKGPEPGDRLDPWDGGRYVGMTPSAITTGSSSSYEVDEWLLREALDHTVRVRYEPDDESEDEDANEDSNGEDDRPTAD
jgi:hypothetical protein